MDVAVFTGGVSMGALDLLKPLLARLGDIKFGRLRMKPGTDSHLEHSFRGLRTHADNLCAVQANRPPLPR